MSVGENIRRTRQEQGMTQAYVAEQAGITQAMLCQIERGQRIRPSRLGKKLQIY